MLRAGSHPHQAGILSHHLHLSRIKEILQPLNLQSLQSFPVNFDVNFQTLHSQQLTPKFTFTPLSVIEGIRATLFLTSQNKTRSNLRSSCQGYMNGAFHAISLIILHFAPPLTRRQSVFNIRFSFFFFFLFSLFLFQISLDKTPRHDK